MIRSRGLNILRRSEQLDAKCESPRAAPLLSGGDTRNPESVILVDTLGELSAVWGLADVAYVGGSLTPGRGGQNMLEPAAYGAAVLFWSAHRELPGAGGDAAGE
uniref:3-deoxy-D-manno-octulosonic acid transferase n=1 Tax=uncultured Planctomyces sp. TaxID=179110 RepID=A0A060C8M6_9PLAN|nr:CAZy families GT30 protein [uncultured Planctomyces sp.]